MAARARFAFLVLLIFAADRILKSLILSRFDEGGGFSIWPNVFHITCVHNTGAAFGLLRGATPFLILLSLAGLAGFFFLYGGALDWPLALIFAGAAGNLYDRLRYGFVVDYLDFRIWPVFNLADAAICVGVAWLAWRVLKGR